MLRTIRRGPLTLQVCDLGATLVSLRAPDADGIVGELTLGFDTLAPYADGTSPYFGCVAGRVANRTAKATFELDGSTHELAANNGANHLHGGVRGFDKQLWVCEAQTETSVTLTLVSADGDEGYPGRLLARVTYSLPSESQLKIEYTASADRPTLVNLTNHTYWNLFDGGRRAGVLEHEVEVAADFYTPVDAESIPTGEVRHVSGAMDLRERVAIGAGVRAADNGNGYDHNYVVRSAAKGDDGLRPAARVWEPRSGRWMSVRTDQPGVQFYTGNYLGGIRGRDGALFKKHAGFCLETQGFPNSANTAHFPSLVLRPGQEYSHTTIHEFGASKAPPTGPF